MKSPGRSKLPKHPRQRARSLKFAPPAAPVVVAKADRLLDGLSSAERKMVPITTGFLDYFPDATVEAARVSFLGNEKHNLGQPLHHARDKSNDHADCIARHLMQRGGFDIITIKGVDYRVRHSAALLWRAAALCQQEIEDEKGLPLPRGARFDGPAD